jgi:membrane-bound serine protease (ClpP class)
MFTDFLSILINPTIAYLLLLIGIYGLFFELINPGFILPGVIGTLALLLALYALHLLPVNYAGLGLILLGFCFIVAEGLSPSFGILGLGGTTAFIFGSMMLINTNNMGYQIAWSIIWVMALLNILICVLLVSVIYKSRRRLIQNGLVTLIGAQGRTVESINLQGQAYIRGEIWSVQSKKPIAADTNIRVIDALGLVLEIEEDN